MAAVPPLHPLASKRSYASVDISTAAAAVSDLVDIAGHTLCSLTMPGSWTDAKVGFRGSVDGSTSVFDIYDTSGNFLSYSTSANRMLVFDGFLFAGVQKLQVTSITSAGVAVAQGANRTIKLGLAKMTDG